MPTLTVRNMVCDRCKAAVQRILEHRKLKWEHLELGEVVLTEPIDQ